MTDEQLRRLNNRRNKINQQEIFLLSKRSHVLSQLGLIDEKLETLDSLKVVVDIQLNEEIRDGNLTLIVHQMVNKKDKFEPIVEIKFPNHPPIFKAFDELDYFLYSSSKEKNIENAVYINHLKTKALEWLKNQDSYIKYFNSLGSRNKRIDDEFANNNEIEDSINSPSLL